MGNDVIEKIRRFFDKNLYFLLKNREIRMYSFLPLDIERNIENSFLKTVNLQKTFLDAFIAKKIWLSEIVKSIKLLCDLTKQTCVDIWIFCVIYL
jgi:hypothetical protein